MQLYMIRLIQLSQSEFIGYDKLSNDSKVTVLTTEEDVVEALSEGDKGNSYR